MTTPMRTRVRRVLGAARLAALLLGAGAATACRGISDLTGPTPIGTAVASVELSIDVLSLTEGGTAALQVTARDDKRQTISDRKIVWSSSDTSVAIVSAAGLVSAVRPGTAQIAVTVEGQSAVARLTVLARTVASVTITPTTPSVLVGGFLRLSARTVDGSGTVLTDRPVFWNSSDPRVVVVDPSGLLTGIAPGGATVTATSEARSATVGVTVLAVPVASVRVQPVRDTLIVGQTSQLTATPLDSAGTPLTDLVTWTSSQPTVATVSSSGFVAGVAQGTATITAASGGRSATASIVVLSRPVGAVIVSPAQASLIVGQTVRLGVQITDAAGNLLTGRPITFASSNVDVATVAADGTVSALDVGRTNITVASEGKTTVVAITVSPSPIATLRLTPTTAALLVGASTRLLVDALDASGNVLGQRVVTWRSGAPNIARVGTDGTVTALAAGTAIIFATSEGRIATATITVTALTARSVSISPATATLIIGDAVDLTATARDGAGQLLSTRPITWSSSNPAAAVVSSGGRVRSVAPGTARIDAVIDGVTGSSNVTVLNIPVATVLVTMASSLIVGQGTTASVTLRDAAGNILLGRAVLWSSSNPAVASIGNASGDIVAVSPGSTTITAFSEGKTGSATLTVLPIPVASVSVTLGVGSLFVGSTTSSTVVLRDANGNVLTGRPITFTSSNNSVATVDAGGVVTAVGPGVATITATSGTASGSAGITVALVPVASVSVALGNGTLFVGASTQAVADLRDANNNVLTGRVVTWVSSNPSVATVSNSGGVVAVGPGTASITGSSGGQSGSASITVLQVPVASVSVTPSTQSIVLGGGGSVTATPLDASGGVLTGRVITYASSDVSVVTVSSTGALTAVSIGSATITATSEGQSGTASVSVIPPPVATVNVGLGAGSLDEGLTTTATAVTLDAAGNVLVGRVVTFSSSNPTVASVGPSGTVTAISIGTTDIIATSEGKTGRATFSVTRPPVETVIVTIGAATIVVGQGTSAAAELRDAQNRVLTGRVCTWSSSNPAIAVVTNSGAVDGIAVGSVSITATCEGKSGSVGVTVIP